MTDTPEMVERVRGRALEAMADTICSCDLTNGFCAPKHNPECKCWHFARLAWQGLGTRGLAVCWPVARKNPVCMSRAALGEDK